MVSKDLSESAVQLIEIFNHCSKEVLGKIPKSFILFLNEIASSSYVFKYDTSKSLSEQNLTPKTKRLIALIYRDFLCDIDERNAYIIELKKLVDQYNFQKREKYNPDNLFKK